MNFINLLNETKENDIRLLWNDAKENGIKLNYQFTKKDSRVPSDVREDICEMTQLDGIARIELRPPKDNCCISFKVGHDKNKARELVGALCSIAETWRCYNDIMISFVPKRIYFKSSIRER